MKLSNNLIKALLEEEKVLEEEAYLFNNIRKVLDEDEIFRMSENLPDMRLCFQRQSQDAGVFQMRLLRTSGKRGRCGCDKHQRARTKLVSLWGA